MYCIITCVHVFALLSLLRYISSLAFKIVFYIPYRHVIFFSLVFQNKTVWNDLFSTLL